MLSNAVGGIVLMVHKDDFDETMEIIQKFDVDQSGKVKLDIIFQDVRYTKSGGFCPKCDENTVYREKLSLLSQLKYTFTLQKQKYYCNHCKNLWEV